MKSLCDEVRLMTGEIKEIIARVGQCPYPRIYFKGLPKSQNSARISKNRSVKMHKKQTEDLGKTLIFFNQPE